MNSTEKTCRNCKYYYQDATQEPCKDCPRSMTFSKKKVDMWKGPVLRYRVDCSNGSFDLKRVL